MAAEKICVFVVLVLCALVSLSSAQSCEPKLVANLTVDSDHWLTWNRRGSEECNITGYIVHIYRHNSNVEWSFLVTDTKADISFLEVCEEWVFVVMAVAGTVIGPQWRIVQYMPLPSDADLTIRYVTIITDDITEEHELFWELENLRYGTCSLKYRITVEQNNNNVVEDIYVDQNFLNLRVLAPCTSYSYGVRAINTAPPMIEGPLRSVFYTINPRRQSPPTLVNVDSIATGATLSYQLESYVRNPCPIREFSLDGGEYFNQTVTVEDGIFRPLVNITVDSLRPNSMYIARASIWNSAGWSQRNIAAIQTPDLGPGEA